MQPSGTTVSEGTYNHITKLECIISIQTLGNPLSLENQSTLSQS